MKIEPTGSRLRVHRSRRSLFEREMPTAGLAVEASGDVDGANRTAASASVDAALDIVDVDVARSRLRTHSRPNVRNLYPARSSVGFDRAGHSGNVLMPGTCRRAQLGVRRGDNLIADRNIAPNLRVRDVTDANIVATLLDWRILFQSLNCISGRTEKPVVGANVSGNTDFVGGSGANLYGAGSGFDFQVYRAIHR